MSKAFLLLIVAIAAFCNAIDDALVECQVCEDVVQTWHDRWRCAGETQDPEFVRICDGPVFSCQSAPDVGTCTRMEEQLRTTFAADVWKTLRREGDVYAACVGINKCAASATACQQELNTPECHQQSECAAVNTCTADCYTCYRLLYEWPVFEEVCQPKGSIVPNELEPPAAPAMHEYKPLQLPGGANTASLMDLSAGAAATARARAAAAKANSRQTSLVTSIDLAAAELPLYSHDYAAGAAHPVVADADAHVRKALAAQEAALANLRAIRARKAEVEALLEQSSAALAHEEAATGDYAEMLAARAGGATEAELAALPDLVFLETHQETRRSRAAAFLEARMRMREDPEAEQVVDAANDNLKQAAAEQVAVQNAAHTSGNPDTVDAAELAPVCHAMWRALGNSRRARFFMSYKKHTMVEPNPDDFAQGLAWDAHSVCKCVGKCPLAPGESLQMLHACKYTRAHEFLMKVAFPKIGH